MLPVADHEISGDNRLTMEDDEAIPKLSNALWMPLDTGIPHAFLVILHNESLISVTPIPANTSIAEISLTVKGF